MRIDTLVYSCGSLIVMLRLALRIISRIGTISRGSIFQELRTPVHLYQPLRGELSAPVNAKQLLGPFICDNSKFFMTCISVLVRVHVFV